MDLRVHFDTILLILEDTATLQTVLLHPWKLTYSREQKQQSKSAKRMGGGFFFKRRFWTKSDKNRIYQCDRFYCLRFLTGIMKATVLFSHYSATHLISSVRSTKATQIFLTPPEHKHQHVLSHMQGPTLSSPQDKCPLSFSYEVEIYWGSIN